MIPCAEGSAIRESRARVGRAPRTPHRVQTPTQGFGRRHFGRHEWTFGGGFQTLSTSRKPFQHRSQSELTAPARASKGPRFGPPMTATRGLEKKRDGFQTLPNDASPPPISTTSSRPTGPAQASANSPSRTAYTERPSPATSTANVSRATANRPHGTTRSSGKQPSCMRPEPRSQRSPTSSVSTLRPLRTDSDAQASPCEPGEVGPQLPTPIKNGAEQCRARDMGRYRMLLTLRRRALLGVGRLSLNGLMVA